MKQKNMYVAISYSILKRSDLSSGEKITLAALIELSKALGFTTIKTKTLASMLNVHVRTIQHHISHLASLGLINVEYRGRVRAFRPTIDNDNKVCVIPDQVIGLDISASYKIAYGVIAAKGINNKRDGYHWESINEFANYLKVSVSSAYRYIARLLKISILKTGDNRLHLIANDRWSIKHRKDLRDKPELKTKVLNNQYVKPPNVDIDPDVENQLDKIFRSIG